MEAADTKTPPTLGGVLVSATKLLYYVRMTAHPTTSYTPPEHILEKYARVLVHFGMQTQEGKKLPKGSVVRFEVPDVAKPLYFHLQNELLKAGYQPMGHLVPTPTARHNHTAAFFTHAKSAQRNFFPATLSRAIVDQIDGRIGILANTLPHALAGTNPKHVMEHAESQRQFKTWFFEKVDAGRMSWTLGLYGTDAMAEEAGMTLPAYWRQIIKACYLDVEDPVAEWKRINRTVQKTARTLSRMRIEQLRMVGPDVDLTVGIGADRAWRAGGGNNVPSYEVFTSPDYRRVDGWIRFNQPLYTRYGDLIKDITLEFKDGICTKATAGQNEAALKQLVRTPGANRLGEFSLTDARLSRITKFMANTLYDENTGGRYGNTHVALGSAFRDCYQGATRPTTDAAWDARGYNDSVVHEDIVSTSKRTVTATLPDGRERVIYRDGHFLI